MDLNAILRLVFLEKNDITVGVLMGLLLLVVILLLIRSVIQEKSLAVSGGGASSIDTKVLNIAIEGAVKKAMSDQSVTIHSGAGATSSESEVSADAVALKKTLSEREAKIAALMSDLEAVKSQMESQPVSVGAGASDESASLQAKVKELQTKLAEYEIIEDDIADLSLFKEENKKLKAEIDKLRATMETAQTQVQAVQTAVSAAPTNAVQQAQAAVVEAAQVAATAAAPAARPPPERFKLDTSDDVMGEFAKALSGSAGAAEVPFGSELISGSGAPLADPQAAIDALFDAPKSTAAESPAEPGDMFGELDTEKMLAEVASLKEASHVEGDGNSILDEELDTDRLMAEMGMSEAPVATPAAGAAAQPSAGATAQPVSNVTTIAVAAPAPPPEVDPNDVPVDDLLAEFKDMDYQSGKKGS